MANLSNINNRFLVTTGGNVLIGNTAVSGSSILQITGDSDFRDSSGKKITISPSTTSINVVNYNEYTVNWMNKNFNKYKLKR